MRGSKLLFLGSIVSIAAAAALSLADPLIIRFAIDSVVGGRPPDAPVWILALVDRSGGLGPVARNLWLCAVAFTGVGALQALFMFFRGTFAAVAAERSIKVMRDRLFAKIVDLPFSYFGDANSGDLVQRCSSDVDTVRKFLSTQFVDIGRAVALLAFTAVAMSLVDPYMTKVALPIIPAILVFSYVFFLKIQAAFTLSDEAEGAMSQTLQENLQGVRVVRAFARADWERARFDERNRHYSRVTTRLIMLFGWYWGISIWLCLAQTGVVLAVGGWRASNGLLSVGTFVVFFAYIGRLMWPVRQLGRTLTELGKTTVSLKRLAEVLDEDDEYGDDGASESSGPGLVEFDRVSFAYGAGCPVLENLSFSIAPGETVAVLGRTGSGKSTLAQLLVRLVEPVSGSVRIDGVDIRSISKRSLRKRVGLVLQEPFLFSKSFRDNVALGVPGGAGDAELGHIAAISGLSGTVAGFEKGWATPVGEEGVTLSGGQRQRASIARTLLRKPDILVLDDSLSAVDTGTDAAIREALRRERGGVTTLIVSHRITTLAGADRIVVLENGRVSDSGTHAELSSRPGLYRRIWEIQAGLEPESAPAGHVGSA